MLDGIKYKETSTKCDILFAGDTMKEGTIMLVNGTTQVPFHTSKLVP